jgi:hypothetical protein
MLASQIIQYTTKLGQNGRYLPEDNELTTFQISADTENMQDLSSPTFTDHITINQTFQEVETQAMEEEEKEILRCAADTNGDLHYLAMYDTHFLWMEEDQNKKMQNLF